MKFICHDQSIELQTHQLIVAGWTGRDADAVNHHIKELGALGIAPPSTVPLHYRVSSSLLTQEAEIQVLGYATSGEVEPFIVYAQDTLYMGLGSDHTDRDLEAHSVAASKQACAKPVASTLWEYSTLESHLDELILTCRIQENNQWLMYQEGTLASIRPLGELITAARLSPGSAMLCGTLSAIGGVRPAAQYEMEIKDPILNQSIKLAYSVTMLPIVQ